MATVTISGKQGDLYRVVGTAVIGDVLTNSSSAVINLCNVETVSKGSGNYIQAKEPFATLKPTESFTVTATEEGEVVIDEQRAGALSTAPTFSAVAVP